MNKVGFYFIMLFLIFLMPSFASATTYSCKTEAAYGFENGKFTKLKSENLLNTLVLEFDDSTGTLFTDMPQYGSRSSTPIKMTILEKISDENDLIASSERINANYMFFLRIRTWDKNLGITFILYTVDDVSSGSCTILK